MYEYEATLIKTIDGDTVELDVDLGFGTHVQERFRLLGVDTPEIFGVRKTESFERGMEAMRRTNALLSMTKKFKIRTLKDKQDKYGRYLVDITLNGGNTLSEVLLREGLAVPYP
jgi:micrococcal nuclease